MGGFLPPNAAQTAEIHQHRSRSMLTGPSIRMTSSSRDFQASPPPHFFIGPNPNGKGKLWAPRATATKQCLPAWRFLPHPPRKALLWGHWSYRLTLQQNLSHSTPQYIQPHSILLGNMTLGMRFEVYNKTNVCWVYVCKS